MDKSVSALALSGAQLFVGGDFATAGDKVSSRAALANVGVDLALSIQLSGPNVLLSWPSAGSSNHVLEQAPTLGNPAAWIPCTATVSDNGVTKSVTIPVTEDTQFFRLRLP